MQSKATSIEKTGLSLTIISSMLQERMTDKELAKEHAAYIVRAVNAHAAMVEALTVASDGINTYFDCRSEWTPKQMREQLERIQNVCEAALRLAKGG